MIQKSAPLGDISGSNNINILRTNLPAITFSGQTNNAGAHSHAFQTAVNDQNSSESQGFPAGNYHNGFRTTNMANLLLHNSMIQPNGNHVHTVGVSSGGNGTPIALNPQSLNVNMFIYLGN